MTHDDSILLSLELSLMLTVGLLFAQLMKRLRLPIVMGELLGGILLGPTVLGRFAPDFFTTFFPKTGTVAIGRQTFIQLGLLCFLFSAGLEMNVPSLRKLGQKVMWTSSLGIFAPFTAGFAIVLLQPELWSAHVHMGDLGNALFIGTALSISALPVIARVLMDLGLAQHELGTIVLASATIDDLIGWSLFAAILGNFAKGAEARHPAWLIALLIFGLAAFVLTIGRWVVGRSREWVTARVTWPGGLIGVAAVLWLVAAVLAEWIGVHAVVGAFFVGVALAQGREAKDTPADAVHQFSMGVFAPIYFVSIGLKVDFAANFSLVLAAIVLLIACLGKISGVTAGARLSGMSLRDSLAVGFGMNARGAMEMILAAIALEHRIIDEPMFVALVVMALITSLLSGPVMSRLLAKNSVNGGSSAPSPQAV